MKLPKHLRENRDRLALLRRFANMVRGYVGVPVYLCGSAMADFNADPRDWDIRIRLTNADFERRFKIDAARWLDEMHTGKWSKGRWNWSDFCVKLTKVGWKNTDLNIDLQIYPDLYWREYAGEPKVRIDTR